MRYYPKRGFGIELSHINTNLLDDFEYKLDELRADDKHDEAAALEEMGPGGPWHIDILAAVRDWSGDHYDDAVFDEIHSWHQVTPMWIGNLPDERGGEISGVRGFDIYTDYLIFDPSDQDEEHWAAFKQLLDENNIPLIEGSWSQLG